MTNLRLALILVITLILAGCSRKTVGTAAPDTATQPWHTLYAPVRVALTSPTSISASSRATFVRDSLIHLSARVFGMEVAQFRATADSAWLVDKFHRTYTSLPLTALSERYNISLGDIQALLLGDADLVSVLPDAAGRVSVEAQAEYASDGTPTRETVTFSVPLKKRSIAGSLDWDLSRARYDEPVETGWTLPRGYTRRDPEEMISALKSL